MLIFFTCYLYMSYFSEDSICPLCLQQMRRVHFAKQKHNTKRGWLHCVFFVLTHCWVWLTNNLMMPSILQLRRSVLSDWIPTEDVPQSYIRRETASHFPSWFSRLAKTQVCTTYDTLAAFFPLSTHIPQETPRESFFRINSKNSLYVMFTGKQWLLCCR